MKKLLIISFVIINYHLSIAQSYIGKWKTNSEVGVISYEVEQSADQNTWSALATITPLKKPDSNLYAYTLPALQKYYRIKANMSPGVFYSASVLMLTDASGTGYTLATISDPVFKTSWFNDNLTWSASNQMNVDNYQIDKTTDGKKYTKVTNVKAATSVRYTYNVFRIFSKRPTYRVTPIYKNGLTGESKVFIY